MIGIVIVSHSAQLAAGIAELARQMVQEDVPVAVAGGLDEPQGAIGTDAMKVYEAINAVYSEDGVLVLMDLGSALLSTEMALEFLPEEKREHIRLSAAPIVEGTLAAVVQASTGAALDAVASEADRALAPKREQMPDAHTPETRAKRKGDSGATHTTRLRILNRMGLHARPAAQFVRTANQFEAEIEVYKAGDLNHIANAKSINDVATLGARQNDDIVILASGPDAREALTALQQLVADNFGEEEAEAEATGSVQVDTTAARTPGELGGIGASPGIAIGPIVQYRPRLQDVALTTVADPVPEWRELQQALAATRSEIGVLRQSTAQVAGEAEAAIFGAHELIAQDPALLERVRKRIFDEQMNAAGAWQTEIKAMAARYREMADEYMQARSEDVLDVGRRVLSHLIGIEPPSPTFSEPSILVAATLTPSDTARLDPEQVLGICTEQGGATAHSAILARAFGIPAVVGAGPVLQSLPAGKIIAIDGSEGKVWTDPPEEELNRLREAREMWLVAQREAKEAAQRPAATQDGVAIEVAANIGAPHDVPVALEYGAEGVGLFRTEFLFLNRSEAPSEEEQAAAYRRAAELLGDLPLIIRTLDIGGDKPLPYLERDVEENPFLGQRGIRFCLQHPEIFLPQLRAILSASTAGNVRIMLPMVSAVSEVRAARELLEQAKEMLRADGVPFDEAIQVGIMIEVPAAVALADQLAAEVDFFSIGTNDLTQYVMAADRGNREVAALADSLQPAILRQIQQTARAAAAAGIWVGVCGELAGEAQAAPLLVGLGVDELSMNAPSIPTVKAALRGMTRAEARRRATATLALASAEEVRAYLDENG